MATWSKKTYKMVASNLRWSWLVATETLTGKNSIVTQKLVRGMAHRISNDLEFDNPRFDRERFYKAIFGEDTIEDKVNAKIAKVCKALEAMKH